MSYKIDLIKVIWACFVWVLQEKLVYNLQENTTMKLATSALERAIFHADPILSGLNDTAWEWEEFSYTEWFLMTRAGREINIKKLMLEYSAVCPIQRSCDVNFDEKFLFVEDTKGIPAFSDCTDCTCSRSCVENGNCCPGTHFGYVDQNECISTILHPKEKIESIYMVGICLDNYNGNTSVIELCESMVRPCTSRESGLIYKNKYCAQCNAETDCFNWKLNVDCARHNLFLEEFDSLADMKAALNQSDCVIQYERPVGTDVGFLCNWRDFLKEVRIDRCNVTGFWRQFDADINWACESFIVPYKEFRNVFCYICNPSHGNLQNVSLIDYCKTHENTSNLFNVSFACKDFPASDRLKPFKNIYCYACNYGHIYLKSSLTKVSFLSEISETNNHVNLSTQMNLSLAFPYESNVNDVKTFVHETLRDAFEIIDINSKPHRITKTNYNVSSIDKIINHYITVCGKGTLCRYDGNTDKVYGNPVCGRCKCENDCAENEACCLDTILSKEPFSCLDQETFPILRKNDTGIRNRHEWLAGHETYMVIDTCLNKSHQLSYNCSSLEGTSDFFADIPVSTSGSVAYRNIYCYACNNNYIKGITLAFQAYCGTYIEHELFTDLSQLLKTIMLYCHTVSFVPVKSKICAEEYDALKASLAGGEKYERSEEHPSNFEFRVIQHESVWVREMYDPVKDVYSSCNMSGYLKESDILVSDICEKDSVTLLSLPEYRIENRVYKNFACFLCNPEFHLQDMESDKVISDCRLNSSVEWYEKDENLEELCTTTPGYDIWLPYKNMYCAECNLPPWQLVDVVVDFYDVLSPPGYKYLFSISPEDFAQMDAAAKEDNVPKCPRGTYDYNLNECRPLYCNKGYQLHNSTCKPLLETASYHLYEISLKLFVRELNRLQENSSDNVKIYLGELCSDISEMITKPFGETTEFYIREQQCQASSPCSFFQNISYIEGPLVDLTHTEYITLFLVVAIEYTETIMTVRTTLITALSQRCNITDHFDVDGNSYSVVLDAIQTPKTDWLDLNQSCTTPLKNVKEMYGPDIQLSYYTVDRFLLCAYVKLNFSEADFYQGALFVFIKDTNVTFPESEYKVIDDYIIICIDDYNRKTRKTTDENRIQKSDSIIYLLNTFTLICTVISLVCIFLTFVTYCLFSTLRTVPGKSLMLLCFSLFCSQSFLQFGINGTSKSMLCVFTGVCIHYFWTAFFCSMHICSFHMFKVFYFNDMLHQLPNTGSRLFIKYLLYFIFFPSALVLITVVISILNWDTSFIGYGANYCFISDFYIFVGTFLTPACLIFLNNIIFFSLAFHKIRSSQNVRSTRDKSHFYIFLKLCTIVGITWPLLIVDNVLGVSWFSFLVSGINSLQGVFIFGSFVLNRRVVHLYKSALTKTSVKRSATRSTSRSSYSGITNTRL
ncbi:uncharacterized protein LOC123538682 [Mercenaria mercenaria]|uniref:uncharacterized protein LOC123538682 n=1 Tax=Mercenaria mercenaria TaxID=6596 RepID=UPI00234F1593|nr:uncharacterized protein LOC123538682 [Mercenaria mercenaria]